MFNKAVWTSKSIETLLASIRQSKGTGHMSDNRWKSMTWTATSKQLTGSETINRGAVKSADACQSRWGPVSAMALLSSWFSPLIAQEGLARYSDFARSVRL